MTKFCPLSPQATLHTAWTSICREFIAQFIVCYCYQIEQTIHMESVDETVMSYLRASGSLDPSALRLLEEHYSGLLN